ncbi:MAG: response regulator transcription factor [Chloroflexi bacterium]|nr:response regulator transcription factor [Chloroflexota bacterium]
MALKHRNIQPLLIPLTQEDSGPPGARKITVHLAISDPELEWNALNLLGRNARFSVVKGSIGYAAEADVRIIDQPPDPDQTRAFDEMKPPRLLFLGDTKSHAMLLRAARAGAWAFVTVSTDAIMLEEAISTLAETAGSPLLMQLAGSDAGSAAVLGELSSPGVERTDEDDEPNPLTRRETEILELIARGESSKDIGGIVDLAEQTIKNYVLKILDKTHTRNRAHATAVAARRGWLSPLDGS